MASFHPPDLDVSFVLISTLKVQNGCPDKIHCKVLSI